MDASASGISTHQMRFIRKSLGECSIKGLGLPIGKKWLRSPSQKWEDTEEDFEIR
jgi:hypothetical protein